MSDDLERAARAMTAKRNEILAVRFGLDKPVATWENYTDEGKADAVEEARAVLESLMEVSDETLSAAVALSTESGMRVPLVANLVQRDWKAMLSTILNEQDKP